MLADGAAVSPGEELPAAIIEGTMQALRGLYPQWRIFWQSGKWWAL